VIPIGPLRARIRLAQGTNAKSIQLLTAGTSPRVEEIDGVVSLTIPSVDVHEVIAIDL
jgi:hypothetical protein